MMRFFKLLTSGIIGLPIFFFAACNSKIVGDEGIFEADLQVYAVPVSGGGSSKELGRTVHHWRLSIPNKYIFEKSGKNGVPDYKWSSEKKNRQVIKMHTIIEPETLKITTHPAKRRGGGDGFLSIRLSNGRVIAKRSESERCITNYENSLMLGVAKPENKSAYDCHTPNCKLQTHKNGWPVLITVNKQYYNTPQKTCKMVHEFLDELTVERTSFYPVEQ